MSRSVASAALLLAVLLLPATLSAQRYDRDAFGGWVDADRDCQDTRAEVLIRESLIPPVLDRRGCRVLSGLWLDPFTGAYLTSARQVDVDHIVPLRHAWDHGAKEWGDSTRVAFANELADPEHLRAVSASANRSKGDRGPADWMPPNAGSHCRYVRSWLDIKRRWGLTLTAEEVDVLLRTLIACTAVLPSGAVSSPPQSQQ